MFFYFRTSVNVYKSDFDLGQNYSLSSVDQFRIGLAQIQIPKGLPTRCNIARKMSCNILRATPCKVSYTLQCCKVASVQSCRVVLHGKLSMFNFSCKIGAIVRLFCLRLCRFAWITTTLRLGMNIYDKNIIKKITINIISAI